MVHIFSVLVFFFAFMLHRFTISLVSLIKLSIMKLFLKAGSWLITLLDHHSMRAIAFDVIRVS